MNVAENQASPTKSPQRGWIFYDGDCRFCRSLARRFQHTFESRGFGFAPFQSPWGAEQTNLPPGTRPSEMRVRSTDNRDFGGADAIVFLTGFVWWGKPLSWFAQLPGARTFLHRIYREIAARRSCDGGACLLRQTTE